ncbi:substrate-binding domain-containing protein [Frankia sp. CcWB2]
MTCDDALDHVFVTSLRPLCAVSACGSGESSQSAQSTTAGKAGNGLRFAYIGAVEDPAYYAIACGAKIKAGKIGATVTVQYPKEFSAAAMTPILNSVLADKPDGLMISVADANAMYAPLSKAKAQGIPIVTALNTLTKKDPLASEVIADEAAGGRLSAELIAKHLGIEGGKVAGLGFTPGVSTPADQRLHNFESEIKKYPNIDYLGAEITDVSPQTATVKMNAILARDPDIKAIFTSFGIAAQGAVTALSQRNKSGVYVTSFDTSPFDVKALRGRNEVTNT